MQLSIMHKVKTGELSIDDALNHAWKGEELLFQEPDQQLSQYNFSVHKHGRYRWQKRVFQIDFRTKMLCSIEKGIIKRQLPFSVVKTCDDGVGSRFTISFKGHHDYELEATSREDKHKIMQLMNQIIYGNIYKTHESSSTESNQQLQPSQSLREGVLLLHRGGLASFKWVKYEVQLHPGQLILAPFKRRSSTDDEVTSSVPMSTVIHLSDGDTRVTKSRTSDTFTLITHKNEYQFRVPAPDQKAPPGFVQQERDAWVQAIDKLCSDWKRKSMSEHMFVGLKPLRHLSIPEDNEDCNVDDLESSNEFSSGSITYPPPDYKITDSSSGGGDDLKVGNKSESPPPFEPAKSVPKPRIRKNSLQDNRPDVLPPISLPTSPTVGAPATPATPTFPPPPPWHTGLTSSSSLPEFPNHESGSLAAKIPPPPTVPAPPPLPLRLTSGSRKALTKAFHWDLLASEKIAKSFWIQENTGKIKIDTSLLYKQFAVKDLGMSGVSEPSTVQHIMLNQKIAHNFNIFLKSFPVQPGELKDKLFIVNEEDGGLSDEHITSLRRYVPTLDDVEMYKSYKGPIRDLHIVDQYMMEMCNIPHLSTQLDLLLTLRELPISVSDLQPLINQKIRMCTQLYNCRSFLSVLEYLLTIGNYLNENAGKEKAKGFRLSSLTKLMQFRGRDKKFTLLHALVEQIMLHEPGLVSFTQELAEFETVPGASIKGLTAEVDVLKNELQKVIHYSKTSKKKNPADLHPAFSKDLKVTIEKYKADLLALTKTCDEMKKLYSGILVKFGEPVDQDSKELFGLICQFCQ
ncbi:uncharacterized protein KZ484_016015 [Pholidichthys leucotaenia]